MAIDLYRIIADRISGQHDSGRRVCVRVRVRTRARRMCMVVYATGKIRRKYLHVQYALRRTLDALSPPDHDAHNSPGR